ncbi:MAG TPA: maleylpyruvate isomerase family mycothiol-dependent enzyme, partial [Egibacteraceae bacterium]|nr:maleylpyruvate isomerase family mycothiol-dependent enzyme [Egibacteraceae bacterium]
MSAAAAARAIPTTSPDHAREVDAAQLEAMLDLLRRLEPDEWERPTDCDRWTVRQVVAHVVGASEEITRPWISLRRIAIGARRHPELSRLDRLNEVQVEDRADRSGSELTDELAALAPRRLRARRRMPQAIRRLPVLPGFDLPRGTRLAYGLDIITIRDVWMHRVDICLATG